MIITLAAPRLLLSAAIRLPGALALSLLVSGSACAGSANAPSAALEKAGGFERFCDSWMQKLRAREKANVGALNFQRKNGVYVAEFTGYASKPLACVAKATGKPAAPLVGRLVYHEIRYSKSGTTPDEAKRKKPRELYRVEVMELFRYDGSSWVY